MEAVLPHQMVPPKRDRHAPVVPCELPDGIQFLYVDDRGRERTIALEDALEVDFGRTGPFWKPPAYRGQRNFPGWWWSVTTRSHVVYGSWLERHHIIEADRDARVTGIAGQPFALTWPLAQRQIRHVPDIFCRMLDGGGVVTDCRPVRNADADFMYKCAVTAAACQVTGWAFRLAGEPDPVWAANLRWLAGYRHPRFADPGLEERLVTALVEPRPLAAAARQVGDPIRVLPTMFHMLWLGRLTGNLSRPLGNGTILTASADPLEET